MGESVRRAEGAQGRQGGREARRREATAPRMGQEGARGRLEGAEGLEAGMRDTKLVIVVQRDHTYTDEGRFDLPHSL